jgi:hypothetical protein
MTTMILCQSSSNIRPMIPSNRAIIAAHASSPATAHALLNEMRHSQPQLVQRLTRSIPDMLPKAYRFSGEMEEISAFVGSGLDEGAGQTHLGLARLYERIAASMKNGGQGEVDVLRKFVEEAKEVKEGAA